MLPPHHASRRLPVVPQPSPSLLALQKKGLELTSQEPISLLKATHPGEVVEGRALVPDQTTPLSPNGSHLTKASSVYSTESAHSSESGETTISQIVEMYTNLIEKISHYDSPSTSIVQPRVYRETIAPLLQRSFSTESHSVKTHPPSSSHCIYPQTFREQSETSLRSGQQHVPAFQEFSRNLRERRAELVSPLSMSSSNYQNAIPLDGISEPSPTTPEARPFSWTSDRQIESASHMVGLCSLSSEIAHDAVQCMGDRLAGSASPIATLYHSGPASQQLPQSDTPQCNRLQGPHNANPLCRQDEDQEPLFLAHQRSDSGRYYRQRSTASDSTSGSITQHNVSGAIKTKAKDRLRRWKEAKERSDIMTTACQKYPGIERDQQDTKLDPKDGRKFSLKHGAGTALRKLSITSPSANESELSYARSDKKHAAIPLTPYQMYGAEVWSTKNKKKRRKWMLSHPETSQLQQVQSHTRPKSHDVYQDRHKRAVVSPSTLDVAELQVSSGKKNILKAAFEGTKHSLTNRSADKRREKLKESIVVIGPTQIMLDNAGASEKSLP